MSGTMGPQSPGGMIKRAQTAAPGQGPQINDIVGRVGRQNPGLPGAAQFQTQQGATPPMGLHNSTTTGQSPIPNFGANPQQDQWGGLLAALRGGNLGYGGGPTASDMGAQPGIIRGFGQGPQGGFPPPQFGAPNFGGFQNPWGQTGMLGLQGGGFQGGMNPWSQVQQQGMRGFVMPPLGPGGLGGGDPAQLAQMAALQSMFGGGGMGGWSPFVPGSGGMMR